MEGKSKSVASHLGEKLTKPSKGGSRREVEHEVERIGSHRQRVDPIETHHNDHRVNNRFGSAAGMGNGMHEGFQVEDPNSWLWGTLFLIAVIFLLSPGVLLTLPPGRGSVWMSGQTSRTAAFVHAVLIAAMFNYI